MKILVQKFGGTSVSTEESRACAVKKIQEAKQKGYSVVTVVSAMGRKGAPYATDTLIGLATGITENIRNRELDMIMTCGEIISAVVMGQELTKQGIDNIVLTGGQAGIVTDDNFGEARIIEINPQRIVSYLEQDKVVVVAGFQGMTKLNENTTIGRGGSDTTACALGAALNAEEVEIYTDVDGVKTADPRIVKEAKTLNYITYSEAENLTNQGAKVIHPKAVEYVKRKNIPLRIRSTFSDDRGTLIAEGNPIDSLLIWESKCPILGITQMAGISQITVYSDENKGTWEYRVFNILANAKISVDFINILDKEVCFTVKTKDMAPSIALLEKEGFKVKVIKDCAKISAVGTHMTEEPGIMAMLMEALTEDGITVLQTADSNVTIWCLVEEKYMNQAVVALHKKFNLEV